MQGFTVLNWYQRIEFSIETRNKKKTTNKNLISSFFYIYIYIFKNVIIDYLICFEISLTKKKRITSL